MLSRVSPQPTHKQGEDEEDFIPVHMLTEEIPADSTRIRDFRSATAEDTTSDVLIQVVADVWPEVKKDCHPFLLDYWTYREHTYINILLQLPKKGFSVTSKINK